MHIIQSPLFDFEAFIHDQSQNKLLKVLEALPAEKLFIALEQEHWTGRKGYSVRGLWAALIAGILSQCHSLSDVARLLKRDRESRLVCGFSKDHLPGQDALERFLKKLVRHQDLVDGCINDLVKQLRDGLPGFGDKLAVDSTDIVAYANGDRPQPADPDARWGAKKKGNNKAKDRAEAEKKQGEKKESEVYYWFGYKLHLVIDAFYELPIAFTLTPANESDMTQMQPLLQKAGADQKETQPQVVIGDKGYDSQANNTFIYRNCQAAPVIPVRERPEVEYRDICNAKGTPLCSCGLAMVYWGKDGDYLKYRCPYAVGKAACQSRFRCSSSPYGYVLKLAIAEDVRRHPPVPRESRKWQRLYKLRTAVERVNSRVKVLLGLGQITVRGMLKVTVRSALSVLVMLAAAVSMTNEHKYQEIRSLIT